MEQLLLQICKFYGLGHDAAAELRSCLGAPPKLELGDIAVPCFPLGRRLGKPPVALSKELANSLKLPAGIARLEATGPYLNVFLDRVMTVESLCRSIMDAGPKWCASPKRRGTIVIDFSHPNIAKPFHLGHLRSTNIGAALARILEHTGYRVHRQNYLGDWGTQFGFVIFAWLKYGQREELEKRSVHYLVELYIRASKEAEEDSTIADQARELFNRLEQGDPDLRALWDEFRMRSLQGFMETYSRLGVKFDSFEGEAAIAPRVNGVIERFVAAGLAIESDGALVVPIEAALGRELAPLMLRKSDGSTTYGARDCAEALRRWEEYGFSSNIYVVARQEDHFTQVFMALSMLGQKECWADNWPSRCENVTFGFIKGLSTRKGNVIWLSDVLDEAHARARERVMASLHDVAEENLEDTAEAVGQAALLYFDLAPNRRKDLNFNWDSALRLEGDTGPYILYSYARIQGILRKSAGTPFEYSETATINWTQCLGDPEWRIVLLLNRFAQVLEVAESKREPHHLAEWLHDLCAAFNTFYASSKVMDPEHIERSKSRVALLKALQQAIATGANLLGLRLVDRM